MGVPYTEDMIANAQADFAAQADPNADTAVCRNAMARPPSRRQGRERPQLDGQPTLTEADALIAYIQFLARWSTSRPSRRIRRGKGGKHGNLFLPLRHMADSWGLLAMFVVFLGVSIWVFRPGCPEGA